MRKFLMVVVFCLLASCAHAQALEAIFDALGVSRPIGYQWQLPTQTDAAYGFITLATKTLTLNGTVQSYPGTETGLRILYVTVFNGDALTGSSDIASGSLWQGVLLSSGTTTAISGIIATTTPNIKFCTESGAPILKFNGWGSL